jgi:hypothetical protein
MQKSLQLVDKNVEKNKTVHSFKQSPTKSEHPAAFWLKKNQSGAKDNPEKWKSSNAREGRMLDPVQEVESQFRNLTPWRDNID